MEGNVKIKTVLNKFWNFLYLFNSILKLNEFLIFLLLTQQPRGKRTKGYC